MPERMMLEIERLGARGDGVARTSSGDVFVPLTLPGEQVEADVEGSRGRLTTMVRQSVERITPVCPHFGACGACALQHMASAPYLDWKRQLVIDALAVRGIAAPVEPTIATPAGGRRRAVLSARKTGSGVALGFHAARSADVVDVRACAVLTPRILAALERLRGIIAPALSRRAEPRITVLDADNGLDVAISELRGDLDAEARAALAARAAAAGIARLTLNGETLLQRTEPILRVGGIAVVLPPGAFVQASAGAEAAMMRLVVEATAKAKKVADLFSGIGTFALPVARTARVLAVDGDKAAVQALAHAHRHEPGLKPIEAKVRDLYREPLSAKELEPFDAIVLDPPHAGARSQAEAIAGSRARTVVAVSCNPATLARDLRSLVDGGYGIERITPIDQFVYSADVEVIAVLHRGSR